MTDAKWSTRFGCIASICTGLGVLGAATAVILAPIPAWAQATIASVAFFALGVVYLRASKEEA